MVFELFFLDIPTTQMDFSTIEDSMAQMIINFLAALLRGICPNLALLGEILTAAKLRGIRPVTD